MVGILLRHPAGGILKSRHQQFLKFQQIRGQGRRRTTTTTIDLNRISGQVFRISSKVVARAPFLQLTDSRKLFGCDVPANHHHHHQFADKELSIGQASSRN